MKEQFDQSSLFSTQSTFLDALLYGKTRLLKFQANKSNFFSGEQMFWNLSVVLNKNSKD